MKPHFVIGPLRKLVDRGSGPAGEPITPFSNFRGGAELDELHDDDADGIDSRACEPNPMPSQIYPLMNKVR